MARPAKNDCEYFPFLVKEGTTVILLRRRWPLTGMGFFTELMRILTRTPYHHKRLKTDLEFEAFFAEMGADPDLAMEILELLVETGKVDRDLWEKARVVVIPDLLESLKEAYRTRSNDIITMEEIRGKYLVSGAENSGATQESGSFPAENPGFLAENPQESDVSCVGNPRTKRKETKGKEGEKGRPAKRFVPPTLEEVQAFAEEKGWTEFNAQRFMNHFKSNGWKVGGKAPMRDWQAAAWNWHDRDTKGQKQSTPRTEYAEVTF